MMADVNVSGSLRRRLALILTGGAALLAVILFLVVRALAAQVAQQGQDNILNASMASVLDTAVIREGRVTLDFPYSSLSMLNTAADDRVFYAIHEGATLLSGYDWLVPQSGLSAGDAHFETTSFNGDQVRVADRCADIDRNGWPANGICFHCSNARCLVGHIECDIAQYRFAGSWVLHAGISTGDLGGVDHKWPNAPPDDIRNAARPPRSEPCDPTRAIRNGPIGRVVEQAHVETRPYVDPI